jgi:hypothetical protein
MIIDLALPCRATFKELYTNSAAPDSLKSDFHKLQKTA